MFPSGYPVFNRDLRVKFRCGTCLILPSPAAVDGHPATQCDLSVYTRRPRRSLADECHSQTDSTSSARIYATQTHTHNDPHDKPSVSVILCRRHEAHRSSPAICANASETDAKILTASALENWRPPGRPHVTWTTEISLRCRELKT